MFSIRPTISRTLLGRRSFLHPGAAFLQANVPFPSSSSDGSEDDKKRSKSFVSVRNFASPAYRRFKKKNQMGSKPAIHAYEKGIQKPSLDVARDMGTAFSELDNQPLVVIAEMGNHRARAEVLKRHIMTIDDVDYETAEKVLENIDEKKKEGLFFYSFPYKFGIGVFLVSGLYVFPMIFDVNTAMEFNKNYVTMELPPPDELDTALETGIWTWNWMEPLIGTLTYTLVCFQLIRQQMNHLGIKPFSNRVIAHRANKLSDAFPQYDKRVLYNYVETDTMA